MLLSPLWFHNQIYRDTPSGKIFPIDEINTGSVYSAIIITSFCFNDCTNIKSIDLKNVEKIDESAFQACVGLENVDLGKNVLMVRGAVPSVKTGTLFINNTIKKVPVVRVEEKKVVKKK